MVDDKTPDQKVWRFFVCRMEIYRVENSKSVGVVIKLSALKHESDKSCNRNFMV